MAMRLCAGAWFMLLICCVGVTTDHFGLIKRLLSARCDVSTCTLGKINAEFMKAQGDAQLEGWAQNYCMPDTATPFGELGKEQLLHIFAGGVAKAIGKVNVRFFEMSRPKMLQVLRSGAEYPTGSKFTVVRVPASKRTLHW